MMLIMEENSTFNRFALPCLMFQDELHKLHKIKLQKQQKK